MPSIALPKSPVSLTRDERPPHVFTLKTRLQPAEFLNTCAKRLLQHNRFYTRHPMRSRLIVLLSIKAGLRAAEIANLTWEMGLVPISPSAAF
jgi:integrase